MSHAGPRHLGHPDEDALYAELDRRNAVVFVHPLRNEAKNMPAYSYPSGMTELVLDTTRAIHNLLWNGTFGKFPNIRWIMPHGGGTIPFLAYRLSSMDHRPQVRDKLPGGSVATALRGLYYDVAEICAPAPLKALTEIADPSPSCSGATFHFPAIARPSRTCATPSRASRRSTAGTRRSAAASNTTMR